MFFIPELLIRRNRGHLSQCWFAATLSESAFKRICNSRKLGTLNIERSCEDVQNVITHSHMSNMRFSLYLSSQLMYGLSKAHLYQTKALEETLRSIKNAMMPPAMKKSKKKPKIVQDPITLPSVEIPNLPEFPDLFWTNEQYEDRHLISEFDFNYYNIGLGNAMDIENDHEEWEFDRMSYEDVNALLRGSLFAESTTADKTQRLPQENIHSDTDAGNDISFDPVRVPLADVTSNNLQDQSVLRTPSKRRASTANINTPSKRRRNLIASLENQENISPTVQLPDQFPPTDITLEMPIVETTNCQDSGEIHLSITDAVPIRESSVEHVIQQPQSNIDTQSLQDSLDITLPPLVSYQLLNHRKNKKQLKLIDDEIKISGEEIRNQINNVHSTTRTISMSRINIDRIRLDSQLLFKAPSTIWRPKSVFHWSNVLEILFKAHIQGPFSIDYDKSLFSELIRHRDVTEKTAELSDSIKERSATVPVPLDKHVTETVPNIDEPLHVEVDKETINFEDTYIVEQPMFDSIENETATIATVDTEPVKNSTRTSNSSDFLPPNFVKESAPVRHSVSMSAKISDINNTRFSSRSKSHSITPIPSPDWTMETLYNELKKRWDEAEVPIRFNHIYPPSITTKFNAACGFHDLLCLTKYRRIRISQTESYSTIWIHFILI